MKVAKYILISIMATTFIYCSNSSESHSNVELIKFSKECLSDFIDENKTVENNFLLPDSTKEVNYSISNGILSCRIYTKYDCFYEKTLKGSFKISDDIITVFMETKSNGLSSTCVCPCYLVYNFKGINPNKKYTVRFLGVKYN